MPLDNLRAKLAVKVAFCAMMLLFSAAAAFAQAPFYQGKTITIIQGRDPGGTGDLRVRALFRSCRNTFPATRPW